MGHSGPKIRFLKFHEKLMHKKNFQIFLQNVIVEYNLKIVLNDFLGNNLSLRFLGQKGPEMCPNEVFQLLIKSQCVEPFWFFA